MPLRHGLDVSVTSTSLEPFTEYGVNTHARSKLVTAKIEARTGVQFYIIIRPEDPFPTKQDKPHGSRMLTRAQARARAAPAVGPPPEQRKKGPKFQTSDLDTSESVNQQAEEPLHGQSRDSILKRSNSLGGLKQLPNTQQPSVSDSDSDLSFPSLPSVLPKPEPPPFDFLVEVFIDGRTEAETRSLVGLNPESLDYDRVFVLKGRQVRIPGPAGAPLQRHIHDWVFTDVGIEVLLKRMDVKDTDEPNPKNDHEVAGLADMLQDTAKVDVREGQAQELKVGKIEIVFTRIVVGNTATLTYTSKSLHDAEDAEDAEDAQSAQTIVLGNEVTHTTR
jgi:hypothetical protein